MVIGGASHSVGCTLCNPPWTPAPQGNSVVIWQQATSDLPSSVLRIHVHTLSSTPRATTGLHQRFSFRAKLFVEWEGCGRADVLSPLEAALSNL
jgi:hypothetical protein